jgi:hypothetical protein
MEWGGFCVVQGRVKERSRWRVGLDTCLPGSLLKMSPSSGTSQ